MFLKYKTFHLSGSDEEAVQSRLPGGSARDLDLAQPVPRVLRGDPGPHQVRGRTTQSRRFYLCILAPRYRYTSV